MEPARIAWTVFLTSLFIADAAPAAGTHDSEHGWYGGVGAEFTHYDLTIAQLNSYGYSLEDPGATRVDTAATGFSVFAGFRHNRFVGIEVGYADFGAMSYHLGYRAGSVTVLCGSTACPSQQLVPPSDYDVRLSGPFVRARATSPIGSRFKVEGRIGWDFTKFENTGGVGEHTSFGAPGLSLGAGVLFAITPRLRAGLAWDKFVAIEKPFVYADSTRYLGVTSYQKSPEFRTLGITLDYRF